MVSEGVLKRARRLVSRFKVCDHCIGRAFLEVEGKDNRGRGEKIRRALRVEETESEDCYFCRGAFSRVDDFAKMARRKLSGYVFRTFRVGTHIPRELVNREAELWEVVGAENTETIKKHLNREIGKILGFRYDAENPDVEVVVDLEKEDVAVKSAPIYLYGRYRKYVEMPQSKWPCRFCRGRGCAKCGFSGRQWKETVEYFLADVLLGITGGGDSRFHASGREDVDARMLGNGRPFVIEIIDPKRRFDEWGWVLREVNAMGEGKVEFLCLLPSSRKEVQELKNSAFKKRYRAFVQCSREIRKEDLEKLKEMEGREIIQRTPKRVEHRRKDLVRRRKLLEIEGEPSDNGFVLYLTAESGLYIKELVSGDGGRTKPSVSEILGTLCKVSRLDVLGVFGGRECSN